MLPYMAADGLQLLEHLGIRLTPREIAVFARKWRTVYSKADDVIDAAWRIYAEVLPFVCGACDPQRAARERDEYFHRRLRFSELKKRMEEEELDQILYG